jgi:hypothetical protein
MITQFTSEACNKTLKFVPGLRSSTGRGSAAPLN